MTLASELLERESQLGLLRARLADVRAGRGHGVVVGGEAGIGKTSLLDRFARSVEGADLWWGGCDALERPIPLAPFHEMGASGAPVGPLLSGQNPAAACQSLIASLRGHPTVIVVEDIHWADEATLEVLRYLARRIDRVPALLVMSVRSDEIPAAHPVRRMLAAIGSQTVTRMELPRLSAEAVDTLALRALRSAKRIHAITGGNPFFVSEMLAHGIDGVPEGVHDVVVSRLARLPAEARSLVELAALVPTRIERWLVEAMAAPSRDAVEAALDSGLLLWDGDSYRFRHELAREAVLRSLPPPFAQSLHRRMLAALAARPGAVPAARLAHHAVHGMEVDEIVRHSLAAAEEARQRGSRRESAAHLETVLRHTREAAAAQRAGWLRQFGEDAHAVGHLEAAIAARRELEQIHARTGDVLQRGHALGQLALSLVMALRNAEAQQSCDEAVAILATLGDSRELARAWQVRAQLAMLDRRYDDAVSAGTRAMEMGRVLGDVAVEAAACGSAGAALSFLDWDRGRAGMERAIELGRQHGLPYVVANNLVNIGSAAGEIYRVEEALDFLQQAAVFAREHDIAFYEDYANAWLAIHAMQRAKWSEAESRARTVIAAAEPESTARTMALVALGRVLARRGDAGAREILDEALSLALRSNTLQRVGPVRAARAEAAWLAGDLDRCALEARAGYELAFGRHVWMGGELAMWLSLAGKSVDHRWTFEPFRLQVEGRWKEAAEFWERMGFPFERARTLEGGDVQARAQALAIYEAIGATTAAARLREKLHGKPLRASTAANPFLLTRRELEVLEHLVEGKANAEIARILSRSVRTVDHHVEAIFGKLGVSSRAEAAAKATSAGLKPEK